VRKGGEGREEERKRWERGGDKEDEGWLGGVVVSVSDS